MEEKTQTAHEFRLLNWQLAQKTRLPSLVKFKSRIEKYIYTVYQWDWLPKFIYAKSKLIMSGQFS